MSFDHSFQTNGILRNTFQQILSATFPMELPNRQMFPQSSNKNVAPVLFVKVWKCIFIRKYEKLGINKTKKAEQSQIH